MAVQPHRAKQGAGHARSGPLVRPRRPAADNPAPLHRAPADTKRTGTRVKPSPSSRVPLIAGGAVASVLLVTAAAALVGGGDDPGATARGARPSAASTAAPEPTASVEPSPAIEPNAPVEPDAPGAQPRSAAVTAATTDGGSPDAVRPALEQVLAARAAGNTALLGAVVAGDDAGAAAATDAVTGSSEDLVSVVSAWDSPELATELRLGLDQQTAASRAYAEAVAAGDAVEADRARAAMGSVSRTLGATLERVTGGDIAAYVPPQDAGRLRAFVDARSAGDAEEASEHEQWLRARLTREGAALARALTSE